MFSKRNSLHGRFIGALLVVAALMAGLAAMISYQFAHGYAVERGRGALFALVSTIEKTISVAVYANDRVLLNELLDGIKKHPLVRSVAVADAHGNVLLRVDSPGQDKAKRDADALQRPLTSPFDRSEVIAALRLEIDSDALLQEARNQASLVGAFMVSLVALLAFVLNELALRQLSRPLHKLAKELAAMEPGTDRRVRVGADHAADEIGTVALATNRFLEANEEALRRERQAKTEIAAMEARYRHIFDISSAGIFVLTMDGRLISSNPTVARMLATVTSALMEDQGPAFIDRVFLNAERAHELVERAEARGATAAADLGLRCADGSMKWAHCLFSVHNDTGGREERIIQGVMYDVTERKRKEQESRRRAHIDALTGLKNRTGLMVALDEAIEKARPAGACLSALYIDLDGFKLVNDQWGHAAGDTVLIESARRLLGMMRRNADVVARLGGDELVVLVRGMAPDSDRAASLAEQIVANLSAPVQIDGGESVKIGASVGVAGFPLHADTGAALLAAADAAMYKAKRSGKGRYAVSDAGMDRSDNALTDL